MELDENLAVYLLLHRSPLKVIYESLDGVLAGPSWAAGQTNRPLGPNFLNEESNSMDRYNLFVDFCKSGLARLGLHYLKDLEFSELWKEAAKYSVRFRNFLLFIVLHYA